MLSTDPPALRIEAPSDATDESMIVSALLSLRLELRALALLLDHARADAA